MRYNEPFHSPAFSFSLLIFLRAIQLPFQMRTTAATAAQHDPEALSIYSSAIIPIPLHGVESSSSITCFLSIWNQIWVNKKKIVFSPKLWFHQYKNGVFIPTNICTLSFGALSKAPLTHTSKLSCIQLLWHCDPPCLLNRRKLFPSTIRRRYGSYLVFLTTIPDHHVLAIPSLWCFCLASPLRSSLAPLPHSPFFWFYL